MRISGVSCLRRHSADGDHTHALVAEQSHCFPDNLVALLCPIQAWNCSTKTMIRSGESLLWSAGDPSAGPALPVSDCVVAAGQPGGALIVLSQSKKAGSSECPRPAFIQRRRGDNGPELAVARQPLSRSTPMIQPVGTACARP